MLSLPDWAFYPLAAAAAGGMIASALSFGNSEHRTPEEIRAEGIVYEGELLAALTVGNGLVVDYFEESGIHYARITASRGPLDGIRSAGAFFSLSPEALQAISGYRVNLDVTLRASREAAAEGARVNLFVPGRSQGDWQRIIVRDQFETVSLGVEPVSCVLDYGYVGIWPDWSGGANAVEIARVAISVHEPLDC
jgi:hypothetical protein